MGIPDRHPDVIIHPDDVAGLEIPWVDADKVREGLARGHTGPVCIWLRERRWAFLVPEPALPIAAPEPALDGAFGTSGRQG